LAPTNASVLLLGQSGTGKELVASAIHDRSPRRHRAFVRVNCASVHADLFESEFFGHVDADPREEMRESRGVGFSSAMQCLHISNAIGKYGQPNIFSLPPRP